ncbi:MAG: phytanoyl-CoA dioxygenase family protein [Alphaproteobacteria bacterium]|nr:phytanoyl-CoA dioxygenase family protein [Alphaproteobacteria bacterium]MBL6937947.1 phytanoyl-CoA dioxygenase family protein [Alphaproteobacteria bacterium]MBL7099228.1 phytanoyl-CoA dioxygenase family protein [Alphaproteobacteria bacterium]
MLQRIGGNLRVRKMPAPAASEHLEREGYAYIRGVLAPDEVGALHAEISEVFATSGIDRERDAKDEFRYGMLNRSALSQKAIARRAILDAIEPLLGEDCHVIANTAWRNAAGHQGGAWHCDAGPHIPRPENVPWPDAIPYPVFAIGVHIFLEDCPMEAGPTAVLPTSHKSGRLPPKDRLWDLDLSFDNKMPVFLPAKAGDAILFVSDLWHRGTPAQPDRGRFFLQCHYGRRDIAQRIEGTMDVNHLSPEAIARAETDRERKLIGLHERYFYDG